MSIRRSCIQQDLLVGSLQQHRQAVLSPEALGVKRSVVGQDADFHLERASVILSFFYVKIATFLCFSNDGRSGEMLLVVHRLDRQEQKRPKMRPVVQIFADQAQFFSYATYCRFLLFSSLLPYKTTA